MLAVLQRLSTIEEKQAAVISRLDRIDQTVQASSRAVAKELDAVRRDLLGESKSLAALSVFNAVVPWLDSLRTMRDQMLAKKDKKVRSRLESAIDAIIGMLQGLGFEEFRVNEGEPFDPTRMECTEYAEGEPGVVLHVDRPGYRCDRMVVRHAGVRIADPAQAMQQDE